MTSTATDRLLLARAAADNMAEAVAAIRASDGVIVYVNPSWNTMFGYGPGELEGQHFSVVNAPTDQTPRERAEEIVGALRRHGSWHGTMRNVRKNGAQLSCEASVSEVDHPQFGRVWISVQRQIADGAADIRTLREALTRYRTTFDHTPTATVLVTGDRRVSDANDAFRALTGYAEDELIGKPLADITHPDDVAHDAALFARVFDGASKIRGQRRLVTNQGEVVALTLEATAARDDGAGGAPFAILTFSPRAS